MEAILFGYVAHSGFPQGTLVELKLIANSEGVVAGLCKGLLSILS